jgi:hypothetical protein
MKCQDCGTKLTYEKTASSDNGATFTYVCTCCGIYHTYDAEFELLWVNRGNN